MCFRDVSLCRKIASERGKGGLMVTQSTGSGSRIEGLNGTWRDSMGVLWLFVLYTVDFASVKLSRANVDFLFGHLHVNFTIILYM